MFTITGAGPADVAVAALVFLHILVLPLMGDEPFDDVMWKALSWWISAMAGARA
jgi:hypothetical protein